MVKSKLKLAMSDNLRKQVEAQIKYSGDSHMFVKSIKKMLKKEFESREEAENMANELGLGRTILYGNMGLVPKK